MRQIVSLLFLGSLSALISCSGTYRHQVHFNPNEPLRVAVLPFQAVDASGKPIEIEARLLIDNLSLVSSEQKETPVQIARRQVLAELGRTNLDLVSSALIDIDLPHHGFGRTDGSIDFGKLWATSPKELCSKFITCDAVLYGRLLRWDRSYYGLQTVNTVGLELKIVSARDGKVLYEASGEDSESRGITKGPTGFSSLLVEPVRGLDSQIIVDLSQQTVQKMIEPLKSQQRPKFLETAPPSIYASSHDSQSGRLSPSAPLIVVAFGSPAAQASFSIGDKILDLPMLETLPGHYYGEYLPLAGESFAPQSVLVKLSDEYGRSSIQEVAIRKVGLGN